MEKAEIYRPARYEIHISTAKEIPYSQSRKSLSGSGL
jgi:hypothetical protein